MADNASQSINNPLACGGPDPRPVVLSIYGAQWTFSLLAPVKFRAGFASVKGMGYYVLKVKFSVNKSNKIANFVAFYLNTISSS